MATLTELKNRLSALEDQIAESKEYSIVGSHTVKNNDLDKLVTQAALLRKRIYRYQGYMPRTHPDFGTGSNKDVKDYL